MNQSQRDFLIKNVQSVCHNQIQEIQDSIPEKPSLNNYVVASFLDDTIQFADIEILKKKIRERVLRFGVNELLIEREDEWGRNKKNNRNIVKIIAEEIFVIPQGYLDALDEYNRINDEAQNKIKTLDAMKSTIILKLQISSNTKLQSLIDEVDNMTDLSLVNNQLMLKE